MSGVPRGSGWWLASDGRWYPPESHPDYPPSPPRGHRLGWPWLAAPVVAVLVLGASLWVRHERTGGTTSGAGSTVTTVMSLHDYAQKLEDIAHHDIIGGDPATYAQAADDLNLVVAPPGYALQQQRIVADLLAVPTESDPLDYQSIYRQGAAEAKGFTDLTNLAESIDPSVTPD